MRATLAIKASAAAAVAVAGLTASAAAVVGLIPPNPPAWIAQPVGTVVVILAGVKAAAMAATLIGLAWARPERTI